MPFETYRRQRPPSEEGAAITIQRKGIFSLNRETYALLGKPDAVELLYDRAERLIGIRGVPPSEPHSYPVRPLGRGHVESTWLVSGSSFCQFYGIPTDEARRWRVQPTEGGMVILDLKTPGVLTGPGRKPAAAQTKPDSTSPGGDG